MNLIKHDNFKAIIFMILHAFAAASLFALVKILSKTISSNQIVFFYKIILLLMIMPWLIKGGFKKNIYSRRIKTYLYASIFGTSATLFLMYGLKHLPLANVTALSYLEKILLIILGIFYFKEKVSAKAIVAIIFSFIGAFIIILPSTKDMDNFDIYYSFIFAAIILWVVYCLIIKSLCSTESVKAQTFYNTLLSSIISIPLAFFSYSNAEINFNYIEISIADLPLLFLTAICYLVISISLFKSLQYGDLAIITPIGYTKIIFAALFGVILFKQYPTNYNYLGYFIIALSSWYLTKNNYHKNKS